MSAPADADRRSVSPLRLIRYLALAYAALIVYASLHPFSGWRDGNLTPFSFLEAYWPRYWTHLDPAHIMADTTDVESQQRHSRHKK